MNNFDFNMFINLFFVFCAYFTFAIIVYKLSEFLFDIIDEYFYRKKKYNPSITPGFKKRIEFYEYFIKGIMQRYYGEYISPEDGLEVMNRIADFIDHNEKILDLYLPDYLDVDTIYGDSDV